jgi:hypothetical protein
MDQEGTKCWMSCLAKGEIAMNNAVDELLYELLFSGAWPTGLASSYKELRKRVALLLLCRTFAAFVDPMPNPEVTLSSVSALAVDWMLHFPLPVADTAEPVPAAELTIWLHLFELDTILEYP